MATRGLILLAHGARDPTWSEPFEAVRRRIEALAPDTPVALAFLDFMTPDLAGAARDLVARGCRAITVVPAFLGVGGHVRRDVPALCAAVAHEHEGIAVDVVEALGERGEVQDAMARAAIAAARQG
jgi:sirohydrochlorin cobaltochelatase